MFLESKNDARGMSGMMMPAPDGGAVAGATLKRRRASMSASQSSILRAGDATRRVHGRRVAPGFFSLLQVPPSLGRALRDGDDQGVIVLSDSLWRSQFGADAAIVDRAISLDGGAVTVVGVMPPLFDGDADFWTPLGNALANAPRDDRQYDVFARVAPAASLTDVNAELAGLSRRIASEQESTNRGWQMYAVPLAELHGRDARASFLLLQAAVACVLLMACANIANILLARAPDAAADGRARRARCAPCLCARFLIESVTLAGAGGAIGVILAMWGISAARTLLDFPDVIERSSTRPCSPSTVVTIAAGGAVRTGPGSARHRPLPSRRCAKKGRGATGRIGRAASRRARHRADGMRGAAHPLPRSSSAASRIATAGARLRAARRVSRRPCAAVGSVCRRAAPARLSSDLAATATSDVAAAGCGPGAAHGCRRSARSRCGSDAASRGGSGEAVTTSGYFAALGAPIIAGRGIADGDRPEARPWRW